MMARILPDGLAIVEQAGVLTGDLLAEEEAVVARAVEKRRTEFAAGRTCARKALGMLGFPGGPIGTGSKRQPVWPAGVVGSITHCAGYCAAAVGRAAVFRSVGIDAEQNQPLPDGVLSRIAVPEERRWIASSSGGKLHWDRILFSAKESIYKAWFPVTGQWLGFEDATVSFGPECDVFRAVIRAGVVESNPSAPSEMTGRWAVTADHVFTAVVIRRSS